MKLRGKENFLRVVCANLFFVGLAAQAKIVEIEWEDRPEAIAYEVEIYREGRRIGVTKSPKKELKANLPSGKFQIRGRIVSKLELQGEWSEFTDFEVPPDALANPEQPPLVKGRADPKNFLAPVSLGWRPTADAKFYRVFVKDEAGEIVMESRVAKSEARLSVPPGNFTYHIQTEGPDGVLGPAPTMQGQIEVSAAQLPPPRFKTKVSGQGIRLSWSARSAADWRIRLERKAYFGEIWEELKRPELVSGRIGKWSANQLPPGLYRLEVKLGAKGWLESSMVVKEFEIKPSTKNFGMSR